MKKHRRNVVVMGVLMSGLGVTCALLLALSPAPLIPDGPTMLAADDASALAGIYQTSAGFDAGRWRSIYIHHSKTGGWDAAARADNPRGFGDHFLIGNGDGLGDGDIQLGLRWMRQQPATVGGADAQGGYISICLVGDFDRAAPSARQIRTLKSLVQALRQRCAIAAGDVYLRPGDSTPAGVGRKFPASLQIGN